MYEVLSDIEVIFRTIDKAITSYINTDIENGIEYSYSIIAYSNGGVIVASEEVTVTPNIVIVEVTFKVR